VGKDRIKLVGKILQIAVGKLRLLRCRQMAHPASAIAPGLAAQVSYEIIGGTANVSAFDEACQLLLDEIHAGIDVAGKYPHGINLVRGFSVICSHAVMHAPDMA